MLITRVVLPVVMSAAVAACKKDVSADTRLASELGKSADLVVASKFGTYYILKYRERNGRWPENAREAFGEQGLRYPLDFEPARNWTVVPLESIDLQRSKGPKGEESYVFRLRRGSTICNANQEFPEDFHALWTENKAYIEHVTGSGAP